MPCWHLHRQLSVLTHLDLPVEAHCRCSFFVDSSRLVSYPLPLCLSSVSSALHCWAAADLAISGPGGACCSSWALTFLLLALLHTRSQISLFIVQSVDDAFFLVSHPPSLSLLCSGWCELRLPLPRLPSARELPATWNG